jgi:hypothetical protein
MPLSEALILQFSKLTGGKMRSDHLSLELSLSFPKNGVLVCYGELAVLSQSKVRLAGAVGMNRCQ